MSNVSKKSGIYIISSQFFPERKYIGSAKNLGKRKKRHFRELAAGTHFNQKLQNHTNKYGTNDLHFSVLLFCPESSLLFWEQQFINYYQAYFNICPTAGSRAGAIHSTATRVRISKKIRQRPRPQPEQILLRHVQKKKNDMKLSEHFDSREFDSPDEPDSGKLMNEAFIARLEIARKEAKIPFVITSGYRTPAHNKKVNGTKGSAHLFGLAADISCHLSTHRYIIVTSLLKAGFTRIGIYPTYIHVDLDISKPQKVFFL